MARKLFDLAVKTGEYTTSAGETKGRWTNVGAVFEGDKGGQFVMLNRWFNPAGVPDLNGRGGDSILLSCFEPKQDGERSAPAPAPQRREAPGYTYQEREPEPKPQPKPAARKAAAPVAQQSEEIPF